MMGFTNNAVFEAIQSGGVWSVIFGGIVEQVIVPVPSPIIPMAAGFLFVPVELTGFFQILKDIIFKAALPFAIGSTVGSTMVYLASWFGGKFLIIKFEKWLDITWEDVEAIKHKYFRGNSADELVIFLSRAIPVVPSVLFSAVCGAIRIKPWKFYLYTALGLFVRGILLGWLGWQSGEAIFSVSEGVDRWETVFTIGILFIFFGLFVWGYIKRKEWLEALREDSSIN